MSDSILQGSGRVLVVEDDAPLARAITLALDRRGHQVSTAATGSEARDFLERRVPELVLLDLHLPDQSGLDLLPALKSTGELVAVVVMTGDRDVATVVEAMKRGADHFIPKPFDLAVLVEEVERTLADHRLRRRASVYQARVDKPVPEQVLPDLVGSSEPIRRVRELVAQVAGTDASVLLLGQTGTGKGMIARGIHRLSRRAAGPFVDINCASIQPQLLESELFGHEKGAFTGAVVRKPGLMEVADGGTLFLDEIAEMEPQAQTKLLSAVENRAFRRVGGVKEIAVDVRLVAATHHDLEKDVEAGTFRRDLFYRLDVFRIVLPPLEERTDDLADLVMHFVRDLNPLLGRRVQKVSPRAVELLAGYRWPGNVRELRNVVERAMILTQGEELSAEHFPDGMQAKGKRSGTRLTSLADVERDHIARVLAALCGNVKRTAEVLGISRSTLYVKMEQYGLRAGE